MEKPLGDLLDELLAQRPIPAEKIVASMATASRLAENGDLAAVVGIASLDDVMDEIIAYPAMALIPAWGAEGIGVLSKMAVEGPHSPAAFSVLLSVALGRVPTSEDVFFLRDNWANLPKYVLGPEMPRLASQALRALVLDHLGDTYSKSKLLRALSWQSFAEPGNATADERFELLMSMLIDSHLLLNRPILDGLKALLDRSPEREQELHSFLVKHPVLLDPFVMELRSKHELGSDFITDFVIRRANNEYVLVEIENSTDKLFNQNGAFSADLMTAVGQVRDFQAWLADNISYAQQKLPGIRHPDGLVVIGRRRDLNPNMEKRLSEENFSRRGHIKIVTYDDLLAQAEAVYRNTIERPVVLQSRDQKTI